MKRQIFQLIVISGLFIAATATARMSPRKIYQTKADGVVLIVASAQGSSSASAGTGSIIQADGTIITNSHVIYDSQNKSPFPVINVFLRPRKVTGNMNKDLTRHFTARVVAFDNNLDLAILKMVQPPSQLTVMTLGDPNDLGPGDETIAIGHPEQGGLWTITTGVIGTEFEDFKGIPGKHVFQMETSLNRGNSGGPLFDIRGYQIGVNTAIARKGQGGVAITGVNFAVKASVVKKFASSHQVRLAFGRERLSEDENETRTAVAAAPAEKPATVLPTPPPPPPPAERLSENHGRKTYGSKATTGGTITVEDQAEEAAPATVATKTPDPQATTIGKSYRKKPTRKPIKFKKRYRTPRRPYTYRRLFTAVDKVRARAEDAFDDLENEIRRRR